jgi:hypothetical protein
MENLMNIPRSKPAAGLAAALVLAAAASSVQADPAHKWRIEFDGRSTEDGTVVLRLNPINGKSIDVETRVPARSDDAHVATAVADSLKLSLGDRYRVQTDDNNDVILSSGGDGPKFDLSLTRSTLTGIEVDIEQE